MSWSGVGVWILQYLLSFKSALLDLGGRCTCLYLWRMENDRKGKKRRNFEWRSGIYIYVPSRASRYIVEPPSCCFIFVASLTIQLSSTKYDYQIQARARGLCEREYKDIDDTKDLYRLASGIVRDCVVCIYIYVDVMNKGRRKKAGSERGLCWYNIFV